MPVIYSNNASTTLSSGINNSTTTIAIASASGFPSIGTDEYYFATIANTNNTKIEVVKVTAGTTSLTVTRAQDGTTAQAFDSGDNFQLRVTAATLEAATKTDVNITAGAISGSAISNDAIDSQHYADGSIDHAHLSNDCIDGDNIQDNAVDSEHYTDGSIDTAHIADSQITSAKIADGTIATGDIADDAVTEAKLANAINTAIAANTAKTSNATHTGDVTGATALTIGNDKVLTAMILDNNVTGAKIASDSIDSRHYVNDSIDTAHYAASSVDSTALASNSVTTAKINDGDVTTAKLAADCITAAKIGDNIINSEHYAADSIDNEHLAADCVTGTEIANDSINSEHYVDGSIDAAHIASDAVTTAKIAGGNVTGVKLSLDRRSSASTDDVYSGNTQDYTFYDADTGIRWYTANAEEMRLENDGDLHVDGDVIAFSTTVSDATLKYDINPVEFALDKINQLKGVSFKYKHNDRESAGLLAQDVEKVMPSAVKTKKVPLVTGDNKEYKTLHYDSMTAILVEAIKELTAKVKKLESK